MKSPAPSALAQAWIDAFPGFEANLSEPPGTRALRREALACFAELGLPHRKLEAWRSTSLAAVERAFPRAPSGETADAERIRATGAQALEDGGLAEAAGPRAVFVDGNFCPDLSTLSAQDSAVTFLPFGQAEPGGSSLPEGFGQLASAKEDAFTALNAAFFQGGGVLEIARGQSLAQPIHLLFVSSGGGGLVCPRLLVKARPGSQATVLLDFHSPGSGAGLVNEVSELFIEDNAHLDWVLVEREGSEAFHVGNLRARQGRDSRLAVHTFSLGGALIRNALGAQLADTGAEIDLRALYIGASDQHLDNRTLVDHAMPHTTSRQVYKGVLGDRSRGVFRGLVHVRPDAQEIDSSQSNMNLLLSEKARIDTQPQLEIHADDVKCSHGSTVGKLDADALFYLRSRGLSETDARALLTRGFAAEILDALPEQVPGEFLRSLIMDALSACLPEGPA